MTNDYVLTAQDGGIGILRVHQDGDFAKALTGFSLTHFVPVKITQVDASQLPQAREDRAYRGAWTFDGEAFGHDIEKAKVIHADKIRAARKPLFEQNDLTAMWALVVADEPTRQFAVAERQRLRDAPADPRIAAAKSIGELKAVWPL